MGNTCKTELKKPTYMFNNPNDKIGEKKAIKNGCGTEQELLKYIPQNGEYEWAGGEYDYENCCGNDQGYYKRKKYLADNNECCKILNPTIGDKTCDPEFRGPFADGCGTIMENYCINDTEQEAHKNKIFSQSSCSLWCSKNNDNKEICNQRKGELCNDANNIEFPECKQWCLENPGKCDAGMSEYCKKPKNIHDPVCSCINSFIDFKDRDINNPRCVDKNCIVNGYSTAAMLNNKIECQNISCDVYYDMDENKRVNIHENFISQTCGGKTTTPHSILHKIKSHPWFNFHNTMTEEHKRIMIISSLLIVLFLLMVLKK